MHLHKPASPALIILAGLVVWAPLTMANKCGVGGMLMREGTEIMAASKTWSYLHNMSGGKVIPYSRKPLREKTFTWSRRIRESFLREHHVRAQPIFGL